MTTAIGYVRISSDVDELRYGVERQREDVAGLAERLGADLVEVFEDNDVSAFTERGPETAWAAMLTYIRDRKPDYVLAYRMDRFGRRMGDIERLDELCRSTGSRAWSVMENDLFANPLWTFQAAQAKVESRNTSERVRRAFEAKRAAGIQPNGGTRPFGFRADRVTIRPSEEKVIREVAGRILSGESTGSVTRWLNESEVPTVSGARWASITVKTMLTNPRYVGDLARGPDRQVIGKAAWPAILDRATFEALQAELASRAGHYGGRPPTASLLGGIVRCGRCLTSMIAKTSGRPKYPYYGYECNRKGGGCGRVSRLRRLVDDYVETQLLAHLDLEDLEADRRAAETDVARLQGLERDLTWRLDEVRTLYSEDRMSAEDSFKILDQLNRQRQATRKDLARAKSRLEDARRSTAAHERWATWTLQQKRAWIRAHTTAIVVHPTGPGHREPGVEIRYAQGIQQAG